MKKKCLDEKEEKVTCTCGCGEECHCDEHCECGCNCDCDCKCEHDCECGCDCKCDCDCDCGCECGCECHCGEDCECGCNCGHDCDCECGCDCDCEDDCGCGECNEFPEDFVREIRSSVNTLVDPYQTSDVNAKRLFDKGLELYFAKKYDKCVNYFHKSALVGHPSSAFVLGECYLYGRGVEADKEMAKFYFEYAARKNHPGAICNLGDMYLEEEPYRALDLYNLAFVLSTLDHDALGVADSTLRLGKALINLDEDLTDAYHLLNESLNAWTELDNQEMINIVSDLLTKLEDKLA